MSSRLMEDALNGAGLMSTSNTMTMHANRLIAGKSGEMAILVIVALLEGALEELAVKYACTTRLTW